MHDWTAVAVIIFGYAAGLFYQTKYTDAKFEKLEALMKIRFDEVNRRLEQLEHPVVRPCMNRTSGMVWANWNRC